MGPWLRSHGRLWQPRRKPRPIVCFNGAVASQPRKGRAGRLDDGLTSRFNGAVASQPRKGRPGEPRAGRRSAASMGPWLRSHGRSSPGEIPRVRPPRFNGAVASQPRKVQTSPPLFRTAKALQWGRGFAATEGPNSAGTSFRCSGFNGAVASQPRKGKTTWPDRRYGTGFNGAVASQPRKVAAAISKARSLALLQWGRGFAATEGPRACRPPAAA